LKFASQRSLRRWNPGFVDQVTSFDRKIRMPRQADPQKKIAALPAARSRFALAGQTNALSFVDPFRNFYLVRFRLVRVAPAERNRPFRSVKRFFECDHDVGFDVASSFGASRPLPETAAKTTLPPSTTKKLFEKITEAGSAEFELDAAVTGSVAAESSARLLRTPSRWRLESTRLIPISTELVVFFPLLRIAQDFVGFIQLLEFFFRGRLVFVDVGMVLARQLAKRLLDIVVTGGLGNAQRLVVISKLNSHWLGET